MISSRKSSDLEVASAALKAKGINCEWIAADCGKEDDITKLVNETMKRLDSIDILVSAGLMRTTIESDKHTYVLLYIV